MKSDFNVLLASTGMLHSPANFRAMQAGIPAICLDGGMTLEMLQSGAITDDMKPDRRAQALCGQGRVRRGRQRVPRHLAIRHRLHLQRRGPHHSCRRCPTDDFDPYRIINFDKDENRKGGNLLYYLFPTGEMNVAPVEGSANGKLVIDLTMHHIGRLG